MGKVKERPTSLIEKRLRNRREELRVRLAELDRDMRAGGSPLSADWAEQSSERAGEEVMVSVRATMERELRELESALRRIDEGTYGFCRRCGAPIAAARLYSVPHAECCSECADTRAHGAARW